MNSYDEVVPNHTRLADQTEIQLNVSSLVESLTNLPCSLEGKASLILKGSFSDKPVAIRKIPASFRDRADRDLKVMEETQDLSETANYYFRFHLPLSTVFLMPLYEHNLEQYLQIKQPKRPSQNNIIYNIALGLSELHKRGIVHMDLRPTKIFVQGETGKERIILSNFRKSKVGGTLTRIMTKSPFAASEVRDRVPTEVSDKADSFSLGMIAFFIWSYRKAEGEAFRTFPGPKYVMGLKVDYINEADERFLGSLLKVAEHERLSAKEAVFHPALWGKDGIGFYMLMLDDILRTQTSGDEKWKDDFDAKASDDWLKKEKVKIVLSGMQDPKSYTSKKKCFVRFIRNLFSHYRTIETAKKEIPTKEGLSNWVLDHFGSLFFDIFARSFRHMDGFFSRFFPR